MNWSVMCRIVQTAIPNRVLSTVDIADYHARYHSMLHTPRRMRKMPTSAGDDQTCKLRVPIPGVVESCSIQPALYHLFALYFAPLAVLIY